MRFGLLSACLLFPVLFDLMLQYFDLKNKITEHVFNNYERPLNYNFLSTQLSFFMVSEIYEDVWL